MQVILLQEREKKKKERKKEKKEREKEKGRTEERRGFAYTHMLNLLKKGSEREYEKNGVKWGRRLIRKGCYEKYQLQLCTTGMENSVIRYAPVPK